TPFGRKLAAETSVKHALPSPRASFHSIASSARARSVSHTSRPSVPFKHDRRTHCDLGTISAGAAQSFGTISTINTRAGRFVLFCAVCARFPVERHHCDSQPCSGRLDILPLPHIRRVFCVEEDCNLGHRADNFACKLKLLPRQPFQVGAHPGYICSRTRLTHYQSKAHRVIE